MDIGVGPQKSLVGTRYRLRSIQNAAGTSIVNGHSYLYDEVDRRTQATLADNSSWAYGYDDRNEVISGKRYWADWTPVAGQQFEYGFDTIGNRTQTKAGGDAGGSGLLSTSYTNNALNQVTGRGVPGYVDITGAATATATSVTVNGQTVDHRKVEYYWKKLAVANSSGPLWQGVTNSATLSNQTATVPGKLLIPPAGQSFQWDADGNLTNDLVWRYRWDGENRLVEMTNVTGLATEGRRKLVFGYDSEGRRSAKTVYGWDAGTTNWAPSPLLERRYVYDVGADGQGWNLVAELELTNGTPVLVRSYLWGTDLSGSLPDGPQGAGGVGGLLAVTVHTGVANTHFAGCDGNGNVVVLVDGTDKSVSGRYEYGPFGEAIRVTGPMGTANPLRFSTKFTDEETGLVYYGYRFYSPSLGRWINRDPIEEKGGLNLYAFCANNPLTVIDTDGRENLQTQLTAAGIAQFVASRIMAGALWAKNTTEFYLCVGLYYGITWSQMAYNSACTYANNASLYASVQAMAAGRYASAAMQSAYANTTMYLATHADRVVHVLNALKGYSISGLPDGNAPSIFGHCVSMRKEYSARMAAALDAAIDFLCDPNSPVAVQSEDTVKGSDCHGAGWPGDLPDRLQAFDSPEARWPGDLADRHPSP